MAGIYVLSHTYKPNVFKIGCSKNIARRTKDGDYVTMFLDEELPKFCGWISVDGYETSKEVRYLEQSIFRQLAHKRLANNRELFRDITLEEVAFCISNLKLDPKMHTEMPIDNGIKIGKELDLSKISVKKFQTPILAKMKTYFDSNDRGKLILPCGYGKMYLALFLIRDKFNKAVIACPSLLLCQQFTEVARIICPEHSIGLKEGDKWLIITTYHSIKDCEGYNPELFVVDEAHRTCVMNKSAEQKSLFRSLLSFPTRKYLFMTATEKVLKEKIQDINDEEYDDEKAWYSMNNKNTYGDEICRKDFSEAIGEGMVSDYRLAIINNQNPIQVIVSAQQTLGLKWLLTYHTSRESASNFHQQLNSIGICAFYIDGDMSMGQRNYILQLFENVPYSVLCSVNVLAEGLRLPFVDSVYFC